MSFLSELELAGAEVVVSVTTEHKGFICIAFPFPPLVAYTQVMLLVFESHITEVYRLGHVG